MIFFGRLKREREREREGKREREREREKLEEFYDKEKKKLKYLLRTLRRVFVISLTAQKNKMRHSIIKRIPPKLYIYIYIFM